MVFHRNGQNASGFYLVMFDKLPSGASCLSCSLKDCFFCIFPLLTTVTREPSRFFFFFLYMFFGEPAVNFSQYFPLLPLTEVSPQPSAIPGGNPPGDGQSAVGWGDTGFEPGTAGQQSGALQDSLGVSQCVS
jgi:hypothetical protein